MSSDSANPHPHARIKRAQFGLASLLMLVWTAAAILAFIREFVVWPLWISWAVLILAIDHKLSPRLDRMRSSAGVVLLLLMLLTLAVLTVLSAFAWASRAAAS